MRQTKALGDSGEELVAEYVQNQGYTILALNYRSPYGEIDLIARKGVTIACIEVKTRKAEYFSIASVVTLSKQKKIIKTAKLFLLRSDLATSEVLCRFDVATVLKNEKETQINYLENAFFGE